MSTKDDLSIFANQVKSSAVKKTSWKCQEIVYEEVNKAVASGDYKTENLLRSILFKISNIEDTDIDIGV